MARPTIGVLGLGVFGRSIVNTLSNFDCDIIAVDDHEEAINHYEAILTHGVVGDFTDFELLQAAGIDTCDTVVVATGQHLESSVLAVMHCKNLGVEKVIAKVKSKTTRQVLEKIGADRVISPERETGVSLAKHILHRETTDIIQLDKDVSIIEFYPPQRWIGKSLSQLELRRNYKLNIIGFREQRDSNLNIHVSADYVFKEGELLMAVTESELVDNFESLISRL
ncbi:MULTISPECIES: TrkA family potassium uptake protein [unclassified Streptococcus]|uniref:potassium channel family protein n=1 Tax=unclassified Streptococcus TaxID=2608887 RepID=UPI0018AA95B3|nr:MULTISPECIES: TrkA family potassium uptake protein [unclassified Streptococcus]MBF8970031.1 TrkA family potassium uptake protein [Streptococcus sp. NLN76]MBG9367253.1 TrkA family potassium uptake protein [Streptococcus sp. NLN64]MBJ6746513.1 TrkA family potassium uptake protein [Streptococcus sp. 121]